MTTTITTHSTIIITNLTTTAAAETASSATSVMAEAFSTITNKMTRVDFSIPFITGDSLTTTTKAATLIRAIKADFSEISSAMTTIAFSTGISELRLAKRRTRDRSREIAKL